MNRYVVSPRAREDLQSIWDYIALTNRNPRAADRLIDRLTKAFVALAGQPLMGEARHDLRPSLRMFSVGNYVICPFREVAHLFNPPRAETRAPVRAWNS